MGDNTGIEWTDATWNPTTGCTKVSQGCKHCYAEVMAKRLAGRAGYPADEPFRLTLHPDRLTLPLRWKRPRRVFVNSMSDLFHKDVPNEFILRVFDVMHQCPRHTFQVLTKRPERMAEFLNAMVDDGGWGRLPPHIWIGTSVENQEGADTRIPHLLCCPATVRFLSCEPLLGPVDIERYLWLSGPSTAGPWRDALGRLRGCGGVGGQTISRVRSGNIGWVIAGGESGPGARPMHPRWAQDLRDQCAEAAVPFFFKQWGNWLPATQDPDFGTSPALVRSCLAGDGKSGDVGLWTARGKKGSGALLDGRLWREMPGVGDAR